MASSLEYPLCSIATTSSIRVHFPASYISLLECKQLVFFLQSFKKAIAATKAINIPAILAASKGNWLVAVPMFKSICENVGHN